MMEFIYAQSQHRQPKAMGATRTTYLKCSGFLFYFVYVLLFMSQFTYGIDNDEDFFIQSYSHQHALVSSYSSSALFHSYNAIQTPSREEMSDLLAHGEQYCASRWPQQCCPGRKDDCTVPILDTVCYCDIFCNRTVTDCCPDFWHYCMGIQAPDGAMEHPTASDDMSATLPMPVTNNCFLVDRIYGLGDEIQINCNNCTCTMVPYQSEYNWQCTQKVCLTRPELLSHINSGNYGWKSTNYSMFWGMSLEDGVNYRLGTRRPTQPVKQMTSLRVHINDILPAHFDAREEWPGLIQPISDQESCGASWAFSTTSVAADRLSLHSNGVLGNDLRLSAQQLISCNVDDLQQGCQGGHLDRAWWFLRRVGVVSADCYPYESGESRDSGECHIPRYKMLARRVKCHSSKMGHTSHVFQASPPYRIAPNEREIMKEILDNGPVQATMEVKEDFFTYKGGVYRYSLPANYLPPNHRKTGFHSVKIIGWGTSHSSSTPLKYWLCANSWGDKWGEDGHFRIVRGTNECKIESFVVGVWGAVDGRPLVSRRQTNRKSRESDRKESDKLAKETLETKYAQEG